MKYELPVAGRKVKPQQVTALHLFSALAFIGTGAIIFVYNFQITYWGLALMTLGVLLAIVVIARNRVVTHGKANMLFRGLELGVSLALMALSLKEQWKFPIAIFSMLSAALLFSLYWERDASEQLLVVIDEGGIRLPATSRRRHIPWAEVEQVLIRFGILSIDCRNNMLYQFSLSAEIADATAIERASDNWIEQNKPAPGVADW